MPMPRGEKAFRGRLLRDLEPADLLIARDRWQEEGNPALAADQAGLSRVQAGYLRGATRLQLRGLESFLPARAVLVPVDGSGVAYPRGGGKTPRPMTRGQLSAAL